MPAVVPATCALPFASIAIPLTNEPSMPPIKLENVSCEPAGLNRETNPPAVDCTGNTSGKLVSLVVPVTQIPPNPSNAIPLVDVVTELGVTLPYRKVE